MHLPAKYASPAPSTSSMMRISGSIAVAVENASRAYIPAEYVLIGCSMNSSSSANSTISSSIRRIFAGEWQSPWYARYAAMFCLPVNSG